jgi:hypothetical protein
MISERRPVARCGSSRRTADRDRHGRRDETDQRDLPGGYTDPKLIRLRIGQGTFRVMVTGAYQRSCAITRERALPALEAAHIRPFAELERHTPRTVCCCAPMCTGPSMPDTLPSRPNTGSRPARA